MNLELISFKLCPFVQRSVITLLYKGTPYDITYIELDNPPKWFQDISPFGKVPVLKVEDTVIFESAVINEYIDEVTPGNLNPDEPLKKALNRSWVEVAATGIFDFYHAIISQDDEALSREVGPVIGRLSASCHRRQAKSIERMGPEWISTQRLGKPLQRLIRLACLVVGATIFKGE